MAKEVVATKVMVPSGIEIAWMAGANTCIMLTTKSEMKETMYGLI